MAMADIKQKLQSLNTRQKVTVGVFAVVVLVILWQVIGLFGGGAPSTPTPIGPAKPTTISAAGPGAVPQGGKAMTGSMPSTSPQQMRPQPAQLLKQPPMSQREADLLKLQQETQAKYLSAINDLQMLKVERELAETNQAIATAKLATITAEKSIVDLLAPPAPPVTPETYAKGLVAPSSTGKGQATQAPPQEQVAPPPVEINYTVISVSQLQYKWNAVLGYQGNLYNVTVGDTLPLDSAKVISIDRSGVVLEKNGARKKISLVPII